MQFLFTKRLWTVLAVVSQIIFLPAQSHYLKVGQSPPKISYLSYIDSRSVTLPVTTARGTVYLLDFWATWCAPCIASIPKMDSLVEAFRGRNVKFISVTYEPKKMVEKFLKKHPMKSEVALDEDFAMFRSYNAWAIPNIVMINANGEIAGRIHPNRLTKNVIEELLEGKIPDVQQTREDLYEPDGAEKYFRSLLEK